MSANLQSRFPTPGPAIRSNRMARRGFSAVELIAVATIIVILSMILVQALRSRVEDSRAAATQSELAELADVMNTCYAETGHWFRLQDYDNTQEYNENIVDHAKEVPYAYYNREFIKVGISVGERAILKEKWNGPYTVMPNYMLIRDLAANPAYGVMVEEVAGAGPGDDGTRTDNSGACIYWENRGSGTDRDDKYPLDAWGNPYIFESNYWGAFLYSMGPDGLPGPNPTTGVSDPLVADDFYSYSERFRQDGNLGHPESDDIAFEVQ